MSILSEPAFSRYTSMQQSGHTIAQLVQPVQFGPVDCAGKYPLLLDFSEIVITLFGHAPRQRAQPLQRSKSIVIFPAIWIFYRRERKERREKIRKNNFPLFFGLQGNRQRL